MIGRAENELVGGNQQGYGQSGGVGGGQTGYGNQVLATCLDPCFDTCQFCTPKTYLHIGTIMAVQQQASPSLPAKLTGLESHFSSVHAPLTPWVLTRRPLTSPQGQQGGRGRPRRERAGRRQPAGLRSERRRRWRPGRLRQPGASHTVFMQLRSEALSNLHASNVVSWIVS